MTRFSRFVFFFLLALALPATAGAQAVDRERLHTDNSRAISLFEEGLELANREQFQPALDKLKAAIEEDPEFMEAHLRYMDAFRSVGRGQEVIDMYRNMRDKNPDSALYHFLYGRTVNDLDEKRAEFRKALSLDSTFYYAQFGIGGTYLLEGRLDEAIVALNKALEMKPDMVDALRLLGSVYMEKGMPLQAHTELERAVEIDSTDVQSIVRLGQACSQLERYETAEKWFRRAAALEPDEPMIYYYLGMVCEMAGKPEPAAENLRKFLELAPDHEMAPVVEKTVARLRGASR